MPRYDFKCTRCNKETQEVTTSIKDAVPAPYCCECKIKMQRLYQPVGFAIGGYTSKNDYSCGENGWAEKRIVR